MSDGWAMKSIGELCEAPKLRKAEVGTVPYIEIGDVNVVSKLVSLKDKPAVKGSVLAPANSLLVSRVRPTRGAITLLNGAQAVSSAFLALQPRAGTNLRLLFYWLAYSVDFRTYLEGAQIGSLYPSVREEDILKYRLRYPIHPAEQQRIVRLLDEAFEGISIAKANAEKSRKSASEVYRTVVGESVSSLALGVHPFNNIVSPIRIEKLSSLMTSGTVKLFRGKVISKRDIARIPGRYPIYSSARDNDGKFGEYGEHMFDEELITWSVDGGGKLFHRKKHKFSVTNVGGILRILDQSIVSYAYLHMLLELRHSEVRFDWVRKAHPSVIRELYINLPIPSMDVQNEVVQRMSEIRQKGDALASIYTQKVNQFDLLKASLLNQVFESRLEAA